MPRRPDRLDALLLDETNSAANISLETGVGCAEDLKNIRSWILDSRQQARDEITGKTFQVICLRSYKPIVIYQGDNKDADSVAAQALKVISSQTEDEEMVFLEEKQNKDGRMLWLGIVMAFLALILGIVVLWKIHSSQGPVTHASALLFFSSILQKIKLQLKTKPKTDKNKRFKRKINGYHKNPNCMIIDERTHTRMFRYVENKYIPVGAGMRDYLNKSLYFLGLDLNHKFWLIDVPRKIIEGETPTDLFIAKHCATEVEEVYGLSMPTLQKVKLGIFVGLCIALLIVIFLIVAASGGG